MSEQAEPPGALSVLDDARTPLQSVEVPPVDDSADNPHTSNTQFQSEDSCFPSEMQSDPITKGREPDPADIIDLTNSDDDTDEQSANIPTAPVAVRVKTEDALSENISEAQAEPVEADCAGPFGLPPLGETDVPDMEDGIVIRNVEDSIEDRSMDMGVYIARFLEGAVLPHADRPDALPQEVPEPELQDSEEESRRASKHFKNHKVRYERRKKSGETSIEEEIAFEKAKKAEEARQTLRSQRKEYSRQRKDEESYLFIPEDDNSGSENEQVATRGYQEVKDAPDIHVISDSEAEKKGSKGARRKPREKKTSGRITKPSAKDGAGERRGRQKKTTDFAHINLLDLTTNNPIEEGRANEGLASQPKLGAGKNKKDALIALIASLPESERDLHIGDKKKLEKASRVFKGHGAMKTAGDAGWLLKGMKSPLHHYQMLGASWMREREAAGSPRGGILGDTMGFGKTVMCLANMVDGKAEDTRKPRATLIVAPSNLVSQWASEIHKHVNPEIFKDRIVYRAGSRVICADPARTLGGQDVVITSYNEVMKSYPRNEPPSHLHTPEAKAEWWKTYYHENRGSLHLVHWHRIILDEAQMIKNHNSITSQAVRCLQGKFRWCLTATPIQNSLDEFWAIMNFLKEPTAGKSSYELFKQNFTRKGSQKALERLQVILGKVMLRRTHANKLFDRPVLQLPPIAPVKTIEVKFNNVERQIYKIVRNRFVQKMKMISTSEKQTQQHYQQMLVLLLRLRQLVGHPLLIQKTLRDLMETEDMERLWGLTSDYDELASGADPEYDAHADDDLQTVRVLQAALENAKDRNSSKGSNAHVGDNEFSIQFRKCLQDLHDNGQWAQINARSLCQACGNPPDNPHITDCHHLYCLECLNDLWYSEAIQYGPDGSNSKGTCLDCGTRFNKVDAYQAKGFGEASRKSSPNKKSSEDAEEDIDWFNTPGPILRSAKIKGAINQIITWLGQDSTNKIIVFVQFRGLIKILTRVLIEEGIGCVQFDGTMTFDARDEAVKRFSEDAKVPVMLAGLKAGGIGLNLTAANRVIILDLWWNFLTENQAFCRAYRIGQKRAVEVVRFVVKDSIDTKMQAMQERKTKEIDSAMEKKNHRTLTTNELVALFSDLETSKENQKEGEVYGQGEDQPFVFPDDPYDKSDAGSDVEMTG